jgi:hypothetical protein
MKDVLQEIMATEGVVVAIPTAAVTAEVVVVVVDTEVEEEDHGWTRPKNFDSPTRLKSTRQCRKRSMKWVSPTKLYVY